WMLSAPAVPRRHPFPDASQMFRIGHLAGTLPPVSMASLPRCATSRHQEHLLNAPLAVLAEPVVLKESARLPVAVLLVPIVLLGNSFALRIPAQFLHATRLVSFIWPKVGPQTQAFESAMHAILNGHRVGAALRY